jgi:hypothetical protein
VVFSQAGVHAQKIALGVVLLLEIFRRRHAHHSAELALRDDANSEVLRTAKLLALLGTRKSLITDHDHGGSRCHLISGSAAEATTSACASFRPSDESLPVKTTT